ncbi:hypothetical protein ONA91_33290 [Micromonospora sp. DR5-3]|uniref:hypothetical protein n=1 Tax=unclassified Micromonospora TaxID=2617518 RepID=UPI0011D4168E|nr:MULTISPECIES: hypothetical protein [unclassified Micromonospora]MCW3819328.1 hypothetical protein [Micromonospora sp. DR5-3]TYC21765.1 hypothetical protein FXF52_24160 [Micromonospora sp. MP36]
MVTRSDRRWGWWGILFVLAFIASIPAGNALLAGKALYLPDASAAELRAFYQDNLAAVLVQSALQAVAAVALYQFGRRVGAALEPAAGRREAAVATAGTTAAAGFLFLSVVCSLLLLVTAPSAGAAVVAALGKATLLAGGPVHLLGLSLLVTASSVVALRSGTRTRWVFHYGRVAGPLLALSIISIGWSPFVKAEVLWRLLGVIWIVSVAVAALRGGISSAHPARAGDAVGARR